MIEQIHIKVLRHRKTGLLVALSDELRGLNVFGRTIEQLLAELPVCLEAILADVKGAPVTVLGVELDDSTGEGWAEFEAHVLATYELAA